MMLYLGSTVTGTENPDLGQNREINSLKFCFFYGNDSVLYFSK